jgi:CopG family nickel-responsive transcriptional regulator
MKKREPVSRCSISLPKELLKALDRMTVQKGYDNRSLAMADMIRDHLVDHREHSGTGEMAGTISIVYDHHKRRLQEDLTEIQHDHGKLIIASMHVHLDHDNCLEVLVTRGSGADLKRLADSLIAAKGVKHGRLTMVSTGKDLPV